MVYGRYNELVFMGFINQQTSLGGTILWDNQWMEEATEIGIDISYVFFDVSNSTGSPVDDEY